jgi:hypothetical protein
LVHGFALHVDVRGAAEDRADDALSIPTLDVAMATMSAPAAQLRPTLRGARVTSSGARRNKFRNLQHRG